MQIEVHDSGTTKMVWPDFGVIYAVIPLSLHPRDYRKQAGRRNGYWVADILSRLFRSVFTGSRPIRLWLYTTNSVYASKDTSFIATRLRHVSAENPSNWNSTIVKLHLLYQYSPERNTWQFHWNTNTFKRSFCRRICYWYNYRNECWNRWWMFCWADSWVRANQSRDRLRQVYGTLHAVLDQYSPCAGRDPATIHTKNISEVLAIWVKKTPKFWGLIF